MTPSKTPAGFHITIWALLTLVWSANMFWMSTESFSSSETRGVLMQILDLLDLRLSQFSLGTLHTIMRKSAHVFEYAVLACLLYRALEGSKEPRWQPQAARWCLVACVAFSFSDEFHQLFVRGRGASLTDCGIDIIGVVVGMLLVYRLASFRKTMATVRAS